MTKRSLEHLKLAFALDLAQQIIEADHVTDYQEYRLWGQLFPRPLLRDAGYIDDTGAFTSEMVKAAAEAHATLHEALLLDERLELLTIFFAASMADDEMDPRELALLQKAAAILRIPPDTATAHLVALTEQTYG